MKRISHLFTPSQSKSGETNEGRIQAFDAKRAHLTDTQSNLDCMKSVYSTKEYWSDDLKYGYRWSKDHPVKDYRHTSRTVDTLLKPFLPGVVDCALEIGSGGGRWTAELLRIAKKLYLVDLSATAIEVCRERFKYYDNIEYIVGSRSSLDAVPERAIDLIFSWGVFVHIEKALIEEYVREFQRVLTDTGIAFIQHPALGVNVKQSRSNFETSDINELAERHGLTIRAQLMTSEGFYPEYYDGRRQVYLDCISIMHKSRFTQ